MENDRILQTGPVWRHKRKINLYACSWNECHILNILINHSLNREVVEVYM